MAYNIYTPMQAPTIPASIFSSAAERGAKSAEYMDTPESARIKGEILGKTKALELQKDREAIESANIMQERHREALEGDKRANKLAPIKEALGIAGSVIGIAGGIQGLKHNANAIELQKDQMELNDNKLEIERQTKSITLQTAALTSENALATATKANDDITAHRQVAKAISSNDSNQMSALLQDPKVQGYLMDNPQQAASVYTTMAQKGVISQAELDQRLGSIFVKEHLAGRLKLKELDAKFKQKMYDELETNTNNLLNSQLFPVIEKFAPEGKAYDPEYRSKLDIVPADLYEVEEKENGTRYLKKSAKPPESVASRNGHWLIESDTGRVLTLLEDKGTEFGKLVDLNRMSYNSWAGRQQEIEKQGKLTKGPDGEVSPTVNRPVAGKMPDNGLHAAKERLQLNKVPAKVVANVSAEGLNVGQEAASNWVTRTKETAKSALNRVTPGLIDNVSEGASEEADTAARQQAEETKAAYDEASPEGKRAMVEHIKSVLPKIPVTKRPNPSKAVRKKLNSTPFAPGQDYQSKMIEELYFNSGDLTALKQVFREQNISALEKVREEGITRQKRTERDAQNQLSAIASQADTPQAAASAWEDYNKLQGGTKTTEDPEGSSGMKVAGGAPGGGGTRAIPATADTVNNVVTELQNHFGWTNQKNSDLQSVANTVQTNSYLSNQAPTVKAIASQESLGGKMRVSWDPNHKGPVGYMQLTPAVEREFAHTGLKRHIPEDNVELGRLYFEKMYARFGDRALAYAAYNAGPGTIALAKELSGNKSTWQEVKPYVGDALVTLINNGKFPKVDPVDKLFEILNYPESVMEYELVFEQLA